MDVTRVGCLQESSAANQRGAREKSRNTTQRVLIQKQNPRPPTSTSTSKPLCNMRKHGFMIANTFFALHFLSFCFHSNGRSLYCLTALEFIPYISMHMRTYLCPYYDNIFSKVESKQMLIRVGPMLIDSPVADLR